MEENVFFERIEKVRGKMDVKGIDAFFVSPSSNLFYLTGYELKGDERLFLLVLPAGGVPSEDDEPFILANLLYKEQVKRLPVKDSVFWKDGENPFVLLKAEIEKRNIKMKTAALEPSLPALFSLPMSQNFPGVRFELGSSLTDPLRQIKDENELSLIRRACRESDRALAAVMDKGVYWIGKNEEEFGEALSSELRKGGVTYFSATIAVGENAALPHYGIGRARIEKGKCFLTDFWGRLGGYYTDCTRTFHFGKPEKEFEKIHAVVLETQEAAQRKALPGNTLGDVDEAARSVIEKYGYGGNFTHRTGHGLGIDIHEGVSADRGVNVPLVPGMVFSIEPGIYLPGRFGVRIENLVAIGEKGPEILHAYPRELKVIE